MRVLVCGGRDYSDFKTVQEVLDRLHNETPFSCVIHGAARGADALAGLWAKHNDVPVEAYAAAWSRYGRAAGMIRNEQMLRGEGRISSWRSQVEWAQRAWCESLARPAFASRRSVKPSAGASSAVAFEPSATPTPASLSWRE